jgi:hypothetical protein
VAALPRRPGRPGRPSAGAGGGVDLRQRAARRPGLRARRRAPGRDRPGTALDPAARLDLLATDGTRLLATTWGDILSILTTAEGTALASEPYDDGRRRDVPDRHLADVGPDGASLTPLEEPA